MFTCLEHLSTNTDILVHTINAYSSWFVHVYGYHIQETQWLPEIARSITLSWIKEMEF